MSLQGEINSVTVEKACEYKNKININDSLESKSKPNTTAVGKKTPDDDDETTNRESPKSEPKVRMYKVGTKEVKLKKMTSGSAFEDRAHMILTEMRKQRKL